MRFADIGGNAQSLALAAWGKWDCDIHLVDLDHKGNWPDAPSDWVQPYTRLPDRAGRARGQDHPWWRTANALKPYEVIANLSGFGDVNKVKYLQPVLDRSLATDTHMITDIRKGSGAYPFLNDYGASETLIIAG